jgi:hypothetical protein
MAYATKLEIDGIDVTSYLLNYSTDRSYGDVVASIDITLLKTVNVVLSIDTGQTIKIYRGWTTPTDEIIFQGYIEKYEPKGGIIEITGKDKLWDAIRKEVTHTYISTIDSSAGKISEIFKDLITTYAGLNADGTTIQDSGTAILLDKFVCNHTDIMERCKNLKKILNWQFYYRPDTDKVYFEPTGYTSNSNILTIGSNVIQVPTWTYDNQEMVNDLTVIGAYQEIETTESGKIGTTSGYTTTGITINFTPISVKVYADTNNPPTTLKVGGLPDSTGTYFYYVDKENKKIMPAVGTTFTTDWYFENRYSHAVPIPIHMYNQASIDNYGQFKKTVTYTDLRSIADAENRGANYLVKYSTPFIYTTLKVKPSSSNNLSVGQLINVIDNISTPAVNKNLLIERHRIRYPLDYEEIVVGDKSFRLAEWQSSVEERLKRLSEDQFANQDIITELITIDNTSIPISLTNRYLKITYQNPASSDELIWGNADYGEWGTQKWTDSSTGWTAEANNFISQYNNTYIETFFDNDFKSASTTATWDNANKWLSFTAGQIGQSTSIDYNNGTITTAKLTATLSSGTFTYQLSVDGGSHWETVTNGVSHSFTNTGTNLMWKITESGASTGKITQIVVSNYH